MRRLIDLVCPRCGCLWLDAWVTTLEAALLPSCECGAQMERLWLVAPSITPNGTRPHVNTERPTLNRVDTRAIAAETTQEIDQKMLRYSDPVIAEEHIRREVNAHLEQPLPTPPPITFAKPTPATA